MNLGFFDGTFVSLDDPAVSLTDRGYQMGDGAYEITRVYNGRCFALKEHIQSLRRSLRELQIPITYMDEEITAIHEDLLKKSGIKNGLICVQVTRGTSGRGLAFPPKVVPLLSATIEEIPAEHQSFAQGICCTLAEDIRWLRCDIQSLNLLGNILPREAALRKNCQEAILFRKDTNLITEGTASNFFIVKDGLIWTHPANHLIRNGVTRQFLMTRLFPDLGLTVVEKAFAPAFALTAEEAFAASTVFEIAPVVKIDHHAIGQGTPGAVTGRLQQAYQQLVKEK